MRSLIKAIKAMVAGLYLALEFSLAVVCGAGIAGGQWGLAIGSAIFSVIVKAGIPAVLDWVNKN